MEPSRDDFVIAIRSAFLKKDNQQIFSLLSLILFSIIFLVLGNFNLKVINFNRTIIKEVVYISSYIASVPENIIKKSFNKISNHFEYYDDYQNIKYEVEELKNKDLLKEIIKYENIELKKLIDDYFIEDSQAYAKVLIDRESPFLRSIIINKGSKNGIKIGMIVYDDIYLIGKVVEVNFLTSRILLISDINSKVPVSIQPLNIQAIMSGLDKQKGKLQYIKREKLINNNSKELTVVTSGSGGMFKSGIPVGKINSTDTLENDQIIVNFYRNFSQLKYVKVLSHIKKDTNIDQSNKNFFEKNNDQLLKLSNEIEVNKILKQQKFIDDKIRAKLEIENTKLRKDFINIEEKLKKINQSLDRNKNIKFLELNLLYGPKCRKSFLRPNLYKINTVEYRNCILKKGLIGKI